MSERQVVRKAKKAPLAKSPVARASPVAATGVQAPAEDYSGSIDAPSTLKLDAHCTLRESIAFKVALLEQLELGRDVILDASAVSKIDTAGLQLLVAFVRQLRSSGHTLQWEGVTPELQRAATQLDLLDLIGLNLPAPGLQ
jgi:anti-anti-sigma regulatory factor